jgi:hypothetical protein
LIILFLVMLAGCASSRDAQPTARIVPAGGPFNSMSVAIPHVGRHAPVSVGSLTVCLDRAGRAELTGIRLNDSRGLEVSAFAARPSPYLTDGGGGGYLGENYGRLSSNGFPSNHLINWACPKADSYRFYEVGVELERTTSFPGQTSSIDIEYQSGGHHGSVHVPYSMTLCPAKLRGNGCAP